jgi:hypothetical protein
LILPQITLMKIWNGTYGVMYLGTDANRLLYDEVDVSNAKRRLVVLLFEIFYDSAARSYLTFCKNWLQRHTHTSFIMHFLKISLIFYSKSHMGHKTCVPIFLCLVSTGCDLCAKSAPETGCYKNCPAIGILGMNSSGNKPFAFRWLPNICPISIWRCIEIVDVLSLDIHLALFSNHQNALETTKFLEMKNYWKRNKNIKIWERLLKEF